MRDTKVLVILALIGGMMGGVVGTYLMPQGALAATRSARVRNRTLEAQRFVLLGPHGERRGLLHVLKNGTADLAMMDQNGRVRAEMRVAADGGAAIGFYDPEGRRRVIVGESAKDHAGIGLYNTAGKQVAGLSSQPSGPVSFTLYDPSTGLARAGLGVNAQGVPALVLLDKQGRDRAEFHLMPDGTPGLVLADENGKTIAAMPR